MSFKKMVLKLWSIWDFIYFKCNRMKWVSQDDQNILRVVKKKYKGPPLKTQTGEIVSPGDTILKIHLYNYKLAKKMANVTSEVSIALYIRRCITKSLQDLSEQLKLKGDTSIRAIMGTTMMNRGAEQLGFSVHEVNAANLIFFWKRLLFKLIYLLIHPHGFSYIRNHGKQLKSKHVLMSINELYKRYTNQRRELL